MASPLPAVAVEESTPHLLAGAPESTLLLIAGAPEDLPTPSPPLLAVNAESEESTPHLLAGAPESTPPLLAGALEVLPTPSPPLLAVNAESEHPSHPHKRSRDPDPEAAGELSPDDPASAVDSTDKGAAPLPDNSADGRAGPSTVDPAVPPPAKRIKTSDEIVFRFVVPSRLAGAVIGKGGCRINQIRADTGAMIKIADAFVQHEERVIIISSRDDESEISNAESALCSIGSLILKSKQESNDAKTIRLLISGSQAGCLIGISGQNIKHMRDFSGADIRILAQNELPSCASAHDRVVQVSGNIPDVLKGLQKVASKLRENPPKKPMRMEPPPHREATSNQFFPMPTYSADHVTSEMMIMEKLVGGLVGRKGYNISRIRNETGATIRVSGTRGEGDQRLISFEGSAQQVSFARMMVENCLSTIWTQQNLS